MTLNYRGLTYNKPSQDFIRVGSNTVLTWRGKQYIHMDIKEQKNG
jgi:hypothetical protein